MMKVVFVKRLVSAAICLALMLGGIASSLAEITDAVIYGVGDEGEAVREAQQRLKELGFFEGEENGIFDEELGKAVLFFQMANGLLQTGELDRVTLEALKAVDAVPMQDWMKDAITGGDNMYTEASYETSAGVIAPTGMIAPVGATMSPVNFIAVEKHPDFNTNEYTTFNENAFLGTLTAPLSTFAADVDTASYAQLRSLILGGLQVPQSAVRIEEMLNYFKYDYARPKEGEPFGVTMEVSDCPWNDKTKLMLIGLQAQKVPVESRLSQNLVFLLDVSGSMNSLDKLPLVKRAFLLLLEQLQPTDTVSIVTYASRDEVVLDGRPAADKVAIMEAIENLTAGGSTAGAAGIQTAYEIAEKHYIKGGSNRILLATDGDLNVGVSDEGSLARMVSEKRDSGVFLSVLGFGYGNYKDNKLEALADYGNGNYHYIDTIYEARKALVDESDGTFITVCKDVKLQLDFNPAYIKGYRLIGYEDRLMAAEDFADDTKDGGEIGSGHRVTALYEMVPADSDFDIGEAESKYQQAQPSEQNGEWLTLSIRAKEPDGDKSELYTYPLKAPEGTDALSDNMRFAAAVAEVGMLLRGSEWSGGASYESALALMRDCSSVSGDPYKEEFLYMTTLLERGAK